MHDRATDGAPYDRPGAQIRCKQDRYDGVAYRSRQSNQRQLFEFEFPRQGRNLDAGTGLQQRRNGQQPDYVCCIRLAERACDVGCGNDHDDVDAGAADQADRPCGIQVAFVTRRLLDERRDDTEIRQADHYGQAHHSNRDEAEIGGRQNPRKNEYPEQKYDFFDRETETSPENSAARLPRQCHERTTLSDSAPSPDPPHTCPSRLSAEANATLCIVLVIEIMDDRIVSFGPAPHRCGNLRMRNNVARQRGDAVNSKLIAGWLQHN
jgi:hypothetical protein